MDKMKWHIIEIAFSFILIFMYVLYNALYILFLFYLVFSLLSPVSSSRSYFFFFILTITLQRADNPDLCLEQKGVSNSLVRKPSIASGPVCHTRCQTLYIQIHYTTLLKVTCPHNIRTLFFIPIPMVSKMIPSTYGYINSQRYAVSSYQNCSYQIRFILPLF